MINVTTHKTVYPPNEFTKENLTNCIYNNDNVWKVKMYSIKKSLHMIIQDILLHDTTNSKFDVVIKKN